MGVNSSKDLGQSQRSGNLVDFGSIVPGGLYPSTTQECDIQAVGKLITSRRLAPFYKGLADAQEPVSQAAVKQAIGNRSRSASAVTTHDLNKLLYNNAVECPICFLYYPANINHSRCCDQPICTECFLQIKRPAESPSSPASCPFCLQENYGVIYEPPAWNRAFKAQTTKTAQDALTANKSTWHTTSGMTDNSRQRREGVSHKSPEVVLVDHVRPEAMRRVESATRPSRSNSETNVRRVAFLRNTPLFNRPGRSASSATPPDFNQYQANLLRSNQEIEEYMVMEAIRMSLADHGPPRQSCSDDVQATQSQHESHADSPSITTSSTSSNSPSPVQKQSSEST